VEERPLDQELELAGDLTETSRYHQYPVPGTAPDTVSVPSTRYGTSLSHLLPAEPIPTLFFLLVPNQGGFIGIPVFIDLGAS
jgi:hypothetical protein